MAEETNEPLAVAGGESLIAYAVQSHEVRSSAGYRCTASGMVSGTAQEGYQLDQKAYQGPAR